MACADRPASPVIERIEAKKDENEPQVAMMTTSPAERADISQHAKLWPVCDRAGSSQAALRPERSCAPVETWA